MKAGISSVKYFGRSIRAALRRGWLRFTLFICLLEDRLWPPQPLDGKRVLMTVFGGLGDCLLFDVLFRRMKEQWPGVRIDVVTGSFEPMWERLESIDHLIYFTRNDSKSLWAHFTLFRRIYRTRYTLAVEGLAMTPRKGTWSIFTSLVLEASRAPERIGRDATGRLLFWPNHPGFLGAKNRSHKKKTEGITMHPSINRLIELPHPSHRQHHEAYYVARTIGIDYFRRPDEPKLRPDPQKTEWAGKMLRHRGVREDDVLVGLVVEATYILKRWPEERFGELVECGIRDGMKFVILGQAQHIPQIDGRFPPDRVINLSNQTNLAEMIAVIFHCDVFLAADTGPAHVAQACGIPSIVLFGPSNDQEFGPADPDRHVLITPAETLPCRPCVLGPCVRGQSCMYLISVDTVYTALKTQCAAIRAARRSGHEVSSADEVLGKRRHRS